MFHAFCKGNIDLTIKEKIMKLFLSYCHENEKHLEAFRTHLAPLEKKKIINNWYDRKIIAGTNIDKIINTRLKSADIIALLISPEYLVSKSCQKELNAAFALKAKKGTDILPILISQCNWRNVKTGEDSTLEDCLVCPTDAKVIEDWAKSDDAWINIVSHLEKMVDERIIRRKNISDDFKTFIENPGDFVSNDPEHPLTLENLYTPLFLRRILRPDEEGDIIHQESTQILEDVNYCASKNPILILGDELSGKTSLCKILCKKHMVANYVPVYIDGSNVSNDNLGQIEKNAFNKQYKYLSPSNIDDDKKIIIFDNFAGEQLKINLLFSLLSQMIHDRKYHAIILVGNSLNALFGSSKWEKISIEYKLTNYALNSPGYKTRVKIIERWVTSTKKNIDQEAKEKLEDEYREHIDAMSAGNALPLYPFYIIMMMESITNAQFFQRIEISSSKTSYGHCYSAIITHNMLKAGIEPFAIGTYLNVLMELAYYIYKQNKRNINEGGISDFFKKYKENYMEPPHKCMDNLIKSGMLSKDLFEYRMQEHILCFFVAKYLSQIFVKKATRKQFENDVKTILSNTHQKQNGNILLFLVHHMPKNEYLLGKLNQELNSMLNDFPEATLSSEENKHSEKFLQNIPKLDIGKANSEEDIKKSRDSRIKEYTNRETHDSLFSEKAEYADEFDEEAKTIMTISKSFRIIKVAGSLLKNEYGTMEKKLLATLATSVRNISFRFIRVIHQGFIEHPEIIESYIKHFVQKNYRGWNNKSQGEKEFILRSIMGRVLLVSTYNQIDRCAISIGSDKLTDLINQISQRENSPSCPAHQLLHMATSLSYGKKLDVEKIKDLKEEWGKQNLLAFNILRLFVANHMNTHRVNTEDRSKIANILDMNVKRQLIEYNQSRF